MVYAIVLPPYLPITDLLNARGKATNSKIIPVFYGKTILNNLNNLIFQTIILFLII